MAQPRGHCVLDGATALAIKVKWDLRGLARIQQGGAPQLCPSCWCRLLAGQIGSHLFSQVRGAGVPWEERGQKAWVEGTQREWSGR